MRGLSPRRDVILALPLRCYEQRLSDCQHDDMCQETTLARVRDRVRVKVCRVIKIIETCVRKLIRVRIIKCSTHGAERTLDGRSNPKGCPGGETLRFCAYFYPFALKACYDDAVHPITTGFARKWKNNVHKSFASTQTSPLTPVSTDLTPSSTCKKKHHTRSSE